MSVGGEHDYVGIIMAKSEQGDGIADAMRQVEGVEVLEQPSFWEIRAKERLIIDFDTVSEEAGFDVDLSSVQYEMSTVYGRMVATDDALMLFSDPAEAAAAQA
ncbi:MAG TPA: MmoB/DmpM family protein [Baekduia sp.]|nr:MmoB/DmpM family protein [Baekduia sp.]